MKKIIHVFLLMMVCFAFSSCSLVKEKMTPFLNDAAVVDDWERVNSYTRLEKDSTYYDVNLEREVYIGPQGLERKNLELHSMIEKPKVEFQEAHKDWLESVKGVMLNCWLLRLMIIIAIVGFVVPMLSLSMLVRFGISTKWLGKLMMTTFGLLTLLEAVTLFMYNFTFYLLSPSIAGFGMSALYMLGLLLVVATQITIGMMTAIRLAGDVKCDDGWFTFPHRCIMILAVIGMLVYGRYGFFLQMGALVVTLLAAIVALVKTRHKRLTIAQKMYLCIMLFYPWVFVYFMSYTLTFVLVYALVAIGIIFGCKMIGISTDFSIDEANIRDKYKYSGGIYKNRTISDARRDYYEEQKKKEEQKN